MKTADLILLDTNVLVYGQEKQSRFFEPSRILLEKGFAGTLPLCVSPQILMEYHSTVTNTPSLACSPSNSPSLFPKGQAYLRYMGEEDREEIT